MADVPLREYRFEIRGTLVAREIDDSGKLEESLKWALKDWVKEVDSVEIFPVYNV